MANDQTATLTADVRFTDLLTDVIAKVRIDLKDTDSSDYRWTDDELIRHLEHAINEISTYAPLDQKTTLKTVAGSYDVDISSLTDKVKVKLVEYPVAQTPPTNPGFTVWGSVLTLSSDDVDSAPADVEDIYIYWGKQHELSSGVCTLSATLLDLAIDGAVAYAAFAWASYAIDKVNIGGANVDLEYLRLCQSKLNQYWTDLKRVKNLR